MARIVALVLTLAAAGVGCATVEGAAARDPMKCERDPACSRGRASYVDCTKQCVDDQQCIDLCREVQRGVDGSGR